MTIEENLSKINHRIEEACTRSGRNKEDVKLIAVTKYVDMEATKEVLDLGCEHIGENRDKQAADKFEELGSRGVWHFIGNLQSRKVKNIIDKYEYIHSLDRLSLAEEIDKRAKQFGIKEVKCFIQVNVSKENTKSGVYVDELFDFIRDIKKFDSIKIVGLMTMAPHVEDKEQTRSVFRQLKGLLNDINEENLLSYPITELSMGMSNDFEIAIEEGATFIRLGSILFN